MITRFEEVNDNNEVSARKREEKQYLSIAPVSVIGVQISKSKLKLGVGQQDVLRATVLPLDASNQFVQWVSNKPDIAEITQNGQTVNIKGKRPGRAILIVTTDDGKFRDICIVTVHAYVTRPK